MNIVVAGLFSLLMLACNKTDDKPDHKFSGKYDVGGHELFLLSYGQNKPAVILESGIGDGGTMSGWNVVQDKVKDFAQVCLYDRAGLGKSEKGPDPRNTVQIANELHTLLEVSKIEPPYIMVGHSMGGLHIQTYAMIYPDNIAAMVFVDPTPKELVDTLSAEAHENLISAGAPQAVLDETGPGLNASIPTFKSLPELPDVPVVVITSSYTGEGDVDKSQWEELKACHQNLADQVSDGTHIVATKSGHYIQMDEPKLVIDAIQNVYDKVK
ncbi:MAG: alpha/beta hydrolase [Bacteroidales bacterium]